MFKTVLLGVAFAVVAQAQQPNAKYDVSERQFQHLLDLVSRMNAEAGKIERDFGTNEVMPRERDRRDFKGDMRKLQTDSADSVARWIERVKKNDFTPPVVPPVLAAPADVTLTEAFTLTSGFSSYYANEFNKAATAMAAQCADWREAVKKNTTGSVVIAQCSGAEQVKMEDGNLGAKVTGQIKISFAAHTGYVTPKTVSVTFSNNSGFSSYYANEYAKAATRSKSQCDEWMTNVRAQSKGLILYASCGAYQSIKGLGGNLHVNVTGTVAYTHRPSVSQPTVLSQEFSNNSGFSSYYENEYAKAATASRTQCQAWLADTIANSSGVPVFASCSGPEMVQNSNLYARYLGQVVMLPR